MDADTTARFDALDGQLAERSAILSALADAAQDLCDEAGRAREFRGVAGQENRDAHARSAVAIGALEGAVWQLTQDVGALRLTALAAGSSVDALRANNVTLTRLLMAGSTAGSAAILTLTFALLWLYADANGQDATAELHAGSDAALQVLPGGGTQAVDEGELMPEPEPNVPI